MMSSNANTLGSITTATGHPHLCDCKCELHRLLHKHPRGAVGVGWEHHRGCELAGGRARGRVIPHGPHTHTIAHIKSVGAAVDHIRTLQISHIHKTTVTTTVQANGVAPHPRPSVGIG